MFQLLKLISNQNNSFIKFKVKTNIEFKNEHYIKYIIIINYAINSVTKRHL
jgi:hypothetical protein